jgi:16S rRNA (uracil1498-N3)-methyltransferase
MPNFFFGEKLDNNIHLGKEETSHLKVIKKNVGETVEVITGDGYFYKAKIKEINKKNSILEIFEKNKSKNEYQPKIHLILGMSKWDRMRLIIEKAVELRVQIISIFKGDKSNQSYKNKDKFKKIIVETLKQTGYPRIPEFEFTDLKNISNNRSLVLDFEENIEFKKAIESIEDRVNIIIGPDSGFSENEKKYLKENKFNITSPGKTIMRFETAAIYTLSAINFTKNRLL